MSQLAECAACGILPPASEMPPELLAGGGCPFCGGPLRRPKPKLVTARKATHAFVGRGAKCEYDWPDGDEPSEPCGRPREEH